MDEPIRQNARSDALRRFQKFAEGLLAQRRHVAHDEHGPSVAENFHGEIDRASGFVLFTFHDSIVPQKKFDDQSNSCGQQQ